MDEGGPRGGLLEARLINNYMWGPLFIVIAPR